MRYVNIKVDKNFNIKIDTNDNHNSMLILSLILERSDRFKNYMSNEIEEGKSLLDIIKEDYPKIKNIVIKINDKKDNPKVRKPTIRKGVIIRYSYVDNDIISTYSAGYKTLGYQFASRLSYRKQHNLALSFKREKKRIIEEEFSKKIEEIGYNINQLEIKLSE